MIELKYKKAIASKLECDFENVFLYWKGRVALYAILRSMGIKDGDEIILPAFTCVVVPNAILYCNAKPVYVDISPSDYNTDFSKIENTISDKTKAIIAQNTFGLSSNIEKIAKLAEERGLISIEDCTHGFGGFYKGQPNGSYCDFAFYSTQWNKPFSTGIGGFLIVNKKKYIQRIKQLEQQKSKPTILDQITLFSLLIFNKLIVNKYTYYPMVKLYRFLSKHNLIIGSNQGDEFVEARIPDNYFKDISWIQAYAGIKNINKIDKLNKLRKRNAFTYTKFLKKNHKIYVDEELFNDHLFLKYPLLVNDRELFTRIAKEQNIQLGDWFLSPIHPIKNNLKLWDFDESLFPIATNISGRIVNLSTDIDNNECVIEFLRNHLNLID